MITWPEFRDFCIERSACIQIIEDTTDWYTLSAWDGPRQETSQLIKKGSAVIVEDRELMDTWVDEYEATFKPICNQKLNKDTFDDLGRKRTVNTSKEDPNLWTYFSGCGDDGTTGAISQGKGIRAQLTTALSAYSDRVAFNADVKIHFGWMYFRNAEFGDLAQLEMYAPTNVMKTGTGYTTYYPFGSDFPGMVFPSAQGTQEFDVNPIPVRSKNKDTGALTGYWDKTGTGATISNYTYNASGKGKYNFYVIPAEYGQYSDELGNLFLGCIGRGVQLLGNGHADFINEDAAPFLHRYYLKLRLLNGYLDENGAPLSRTVPYQAVLNIKFNRKETY